MALQRFGINAYRTEDDEPQFCPSVFLFLDLMGTKAKGATELENTIAALELARDWGDSDPDQTPAVARWFSDNLGLAHPIGPSFDDEALGYTIESAAQHQLALLKHGFIASGAITIGALYADKHVLYGPALNRAVELEKSRTIFPRVVLDEASVRVAKEALERVEGNRQHAWQRVDLAVDGDGVTFVNYLAQLEWDDEQAPLNAEYLELHRNLIVDRLIEHDGNDRVHDKYRWLAAYHDWFVSEMASDVASDLVRTLKAGSARPVDYAFKRFAHDVHAPDAASVESPSSPTL